MPGLTASQDHSADDWRGLADSNLNAARALAAQRMWQAAYSQAGFAMECALKCAIMRRRGLNRWPERTEAPKLYAHDFRRLMKEAGLEAELQRQVILVTPIAQAWIVAQDWSNEARYEKHPFSETRATDMVWAAGDGGLIRWLTTL